MNNQIVAFDFEAHNVRIIVDDKREPWFVAVDVCDALCIANPSDALKRLDEDEKMTLDTTEGHAGRRGGAQSINVVNEPGLYSLILRSRKPEAKRFKRWVIHEVLPSIRKTGAYAHPSVPAIQEGHAVPALPSPEPIQDRVTALLAIGKTMAELGGFNPGMAMASALDSIQANTGLDVSAFRRALPSSTAPQLSYDGTPPSPESYEDPLAPIDPAQLGGRIGMASAEVNARLEAMDLQKRNHQGGWELTANGMLWGEAAPHAPGVRRLHDLVWRPEVAELLLDTEDAA